MITDSKTLYKKFGKRLAQLRNHKKISQQEMADALGIAQSTYAAYETGNAKITLERIDAISKVLGISTLLLISGFTNNPEPETFADNLDNDDLQFVLRYLDLKKSEKCKALYFIEGLLAAEQPKKTD